MIDVKVGSYLHHKQHHNGPCQLLQAFAENSDYRRNLQSFKMTIQLKGP